MPLQVVKFDGAENKNTFVVPENTFKDEVKMLILRSENLENDILLVKKDNDYKALLLLCTHRNFALTPSNNNIYCSNHGAQFDFDGQVLKEPAIKALHQFKTEINNNNITVYLNNKI